MRFGKQTCKEDACEAKSDQPNLAQVGMLERQNLGSSLCCLLSFCIYNHGSQDKQQTLQAKGGNVTGIVSMDIKRSHIVECHALHQPSFDSCVQSLRITVPENNSIGLGQQLRVLSR